MSAKKSPARNNDLAQIHIAKKALGMDDDTYRAMLFTVARVQSAKDLDHAGRQSVLEHMRSRGYVTKPPKVADFKQALVKKIAALLARQERPIEYADGMARKMFKLEKVQWCDAKQLRSIIAALEYDRQRKEKAK